MPRTDNSSPVEFTFIEWTTSVRTSGSHSVNLTRDICNYNIFTGYLNLLELSLGKIAQLTDFDETLAHLPALSNTCSGIRSIYEFIRSAQTYICEIPFDHPSSE